jgi:GTPase SAR1 family protein
MQRAPVYVKALVFGPCRAGKTSIVRRLKPGADFDPEYTPSIGVDFVRERTHVNGTPVYVMAWDHSRYRAVPQGRSPAYFLRDHGYARKSDVAVLVFDASDAASVRDAVTWLKDNDADIAQDCVKALVANKVDVAVPDVLAEGRDVARAFGWTFFETSARDNTGIAEVRSACACVCVHGARF